MINTNAIRQLIADNRYDIVKIEEQKDVYVCTVKVQRIREPEGDEVKQLSFPEIKEDE